MIRKQILRNLAGENPHRLDLASLATFEVTSEDAAHPLEGILRENPERWEAAEEGAQSLRITFDEARPISRIGLLFEELANARTQEFSLLWQAESDTTWRELRRQQFNFSPPHTTTEREDYEVALAGVVGLTLTIQPALNGRGQASLTQLWMV